MTGSSSTPYNSVYEALGPNNQKPDAEVICCEHGTQCPYGRKPPVENQYVCLTAPNKAVPKELQIAEKLAAKLEKLKVKTAEVEMGKTQKKKDTSKKKRKKKPVIPENADAYEIIGPPTEESTDASAPVTTESLEKQTKSTGASLAAQSSYIGTYSSTDAESHVTRRGEFSLYHQFPSGTCIDNLTSSLPLMLVYYTTTKIHRHYPIRTYGSEGDLHYSVDCGYPIVRKHYSLNQLVQYYKNIGLSQISQDDTTGDAFSWWME